MVLTRNMNIYLIFLHILCINLSRCKLIVKNQNFSYISLIRVPCEVNLSLIECEVTEHLI